MSEDRELLEAVAKAAINEHEAWKARNAARRAKREFWWQYKDATGEWFVKSEAEPDDIAKFAPLEAADKAARRRYATARAATRRAIVRAAAAIGGAK